MANSTLKLAAAALVAMLCAPSCVMGQAPPTPAQLCDETCSLYPVPMTCRSTCKACMNACDTAPFVCPASCEVLVTTCESTCHDAWQTCVDQCRKAGITRGCDQSCDICEDRCPKLEAACTSANLCATAKEIAVEICREGCFEKLV